MIDNMPPKIIAQHVQKHLLPLDSDTLANHFTQRENLIVFFYGSVLRVKHRLSFGFMLTTIELGSVLIA